MALGTDSDRQKVTAWFIRKYYADNPAGLTRPDIKAAADAAFDWAELTANKIAYNTALPTAFKNTATAEQKAAMLGAAVMVGYGVDIK